MDPYQPTLYKVFSQRWPGKFLRQDIQRFIKTLTNVNPSVIIHKNRNGNATGSAMLCFSTVSLPQQRSAPNHFRLTLRANSCNSERPRLNTIKEPTLSSSQSLSISRNKYLLYARNLIIKATLKIDSHQVGDTPSLYVPP